MISVQRLLERIVPRFCWFDLALQASLYCSMLKGYVCQSVSQSVKSNTYITNPNTITHPHHTNTTKPTSM